MEAAATPSQHHHQPQPVDLSVAGVVLSQRYEQQLFSQAATHGRVVPVLVITGFLGSGKTTMLQHLLATSGQVLKLGVLVNEVAALDVDGQLLHTSSSNAAAGIRAAQLAGGCACCSVSSDLQAALGQLAGSSSYQHLDYLLLETSGVSDVEPLACSLGAAGFKLAGVVAVVDAEAGAHQLADQAVAQAQLRAADVVVLNKCDLASLAAVSGVEDLVQELVPGTRMLRARFGQVPAEALLDVDVEEHTSSIPQGLSGGGQGGDQQQQQQQQPEAASGVRGEIAFLSHEPVVSTDGRPRRSQGAAGSLLSSARAARLRAAGVAQGDALPGQHSSHSSFGSVSFVSSGPFCMACFQKCVQQHLVGAPGLFRAKGFVWFQQVPGLRYVFHLSGKQRAECGADGGWQGPPGVQLVLIGQQQPQLEELKQHLQACLAVNCSCSRRGSQPTSLNAAAAEFARLVQQHHRFELVPLPAVGQPQQPQPSQPPPQQQQQHGTARLTPEGGLVQFTAVGSPLHGVIADEVNASLLRTANATAGLFLCHIRSPAALASASNVSSVRVAYQGVACLQLCFKCEDPAAYGGAIADASCCWQVFEAAAGPVLRKCYQHVHNCKCDVVQLMTA